MESDQWALFSTCFSSSETRSTLYTSHCVSLYWTLPDTLCQLLSLTSYFPKCPWAEWWPSSLPGLLTCSFFADREPPRWPQPNHFHWLRTHSVLMLFQTPGVFRTSYSLLQPLSLILAFWFLEISIRLDSLHLRTYSGCGSTSSPNSAFLSLNIKYLAMFPKRFVVCGFHVITPTNEGIDHMKTTH